MELTSAKKLPRDAAVESIASAFGLEKSRVEKMFGTVGKTFFVEPPENLP